MCKYPCVNLHSQTYASTVTPKKSKKQYIITMTMFCLKNQETNLSIFKGDLPDQRHTLVLGPSVGQVEVSEWAEVDHVRDALPQRLVDYIVSAKTLRLRYSTIKVQWYKLNWNCGMTSTPSLTNPLHMGFIWIIFGEYIVRWESHPKAAKNVQSSRRMLATFS